MEEVSRVPMVTIPLQEYDRLRDAADISRLLYDRMTELDNMIRETHRRMNDLEIQISNMKNR